MANATDLAIRELNKFLAAWLGPTANQFLGASGHLASVYEAIRAIAPAEQTKALGYAVYGQKPETRERRRESGFESVVVSAVFDEPPINALKSCIAGEPWTTGVRAGLSHFGICQLQQIPT